jgi:hypothetical protein
LREFVVAASGAPRFRAKFGPTGTLFPDLHTPTSREVGWLCLADDRNMFLLHNRWVGGDVWSDELGDYTDPAWETVVLRAPASTYDEMPVGDESTYQLECSEASIGWNNCRVEELKAGEIAAILGVAGVTAYTVSFDAKPCEFLIELDLPGLAGSWQLRRSSQGPTAFTLACRQTPS